MVLQDIAEFSVKWLQILDENGKADEKLMPKLTEKQMLWLYEHMIFTRIFDEKAFKLQRQGRIGTYGQSLGQKALICLQWRCLSQPRYRTLSALRGQRNCARKMLLQLFILETARHRAAI